MPELSPPPRLAARTPDDEAAFGGGLPNANSPALLTHLLEVVARGVRSSRGLAEALGVEARTVRYYVGAGAWLGFLEDDIAPRLTPEGLAYVYGGGRRRALYAAAIERQPLLARLLARHGGKLPEGAALHTALASLEPGLASATVERRASALRGLVAPWREERAARAIEPDPHPEQLALPLGQPRAPTLAPPLASLAGAAFSPDIYRFLLCFLLDHGELTLGHLRGLLDRAGAEDSPIGPYVELALERGDATQLDPRTGSRLAITPGGVARRELAWDVSSVILSDPGWRGHLDALRAARGRRPPAGANRWRLWDERLFGRAGHPESVDADVARVLRDRGLASWPIARPNPDEGPWGGGSAAFLDQLEARGLLLTLPPSLGQLWEGLAGVNRRLRNARHRADAVGLPSLAYTPLLAHGGLLHPGETLPRAVSDQRSLRIRVLRHVPYAAMVAGLLLAHRVARGRPELVLERGAWVVRAHRKRLGPLLELLDGFALSRGWLPSRRGGGLDASTLLALLERLGILVRTAAHAVLDDGLFAALREEEEESAALGPGLDALATAFADHLDHLHATAGRLDA